MILPCVVFGIAVLVTVIFIARLWISIEREDRKVMTWQRGMRNQLDRAIDEKLARARKAKEEK